VIADNIVFVITGVNVVAANPVDRESMSDAVCMLACSGAISEMNFT
jgi:hypothetical protein